MGKLSTYHANTHVAEADILGCDLLVDTASEDDAALGQLRENVGGLDRLGEVHGRHGMCLVLRAEGDLLQAQVGHGLLDLV